MYLILDSSALLSGRFNSIPAGYDGVFITPLVGDEVAKGAPSRLMDGLLEAGLDIRGPASTEKAEEAARATGDLGSLSKADISVIALALEVRDAIVVTDDFRVQNVLGSMGMKFESAGEIGERKIARVWSWTYRCRGCGRYFEEEQRRDECPVCGSNVRKYKKK